MANKIFLIGHGRQDMDSGNREFLPEGVTVRLAVGERGLSSNGVSCAHLRGDCGIYVQSYVGPCEFPPLYLCGDEPATNFEKLYAFYTGIEKDIHLNSWILTPRGAHDVSLSTIIERLLNTGLSTPFELVWTCCRSPLDERATSKYTYDNKQVVPLRVEEFDSERNITAALGSNGHKIHTQSVELEDLTIYHQSDIHEVNYTNRFDRSNNAVIGSDFQTERVDELFSNPRSEKYTKEVILRCGLY
jgi:hypothetical protein